MDLEENILLKFKSIDRKIKHKIDEKLSNVILGFSKMKGYLIDYLYKQERSKIEVNQRDVEKHFKITKATASEILKAMEQNKLITRNVSLKDNRFKVIRLTELGHEQHLKIDKELKSIEEKMLSSLNAQEIGLLGNLLKKIETGLEE